jgi:hypothetical protein
MQPARTAFARQDNLMLQKLRDGCELAETMLSLLPLQWGEEAGIVLDGKSRVALGLRHDGRRNRVVFRSNNRVSVVGETKSNALRIQLLLARGGDGRFGFEVDGCYVGTPFSMTRSMWAGAMVGLYATKALKWSIAGHSEFDYFRFV